MLRSRGGLLNSSPELPIARSLTLMASISTLADLKADGTRLIGHCGGPNCGHARQLDLDVLIEIYGTHYSIINERRIAKALLCGRCKHKGGAITLAPITSTPQIDDQLTS